jgi:hypothetical protein
LNPERGKRFSLLQNVQTSSGAHPASSSIATGVLSLGVKQLGFEADHLHLMPRLRMRGAIPPLLINVFMVCTGTTLPLASELK